MPSVNDVLQDQSIFHAHFLAGLAEGEAKRVSKFLDDEMFPDLMKQYKRRLPNIGVFGTRGADLRLRQMMISTDGIIRSGMVGAKALSASGMRAAALAEVDWQKAALTKAVGPLNIGINTPNIPVLRQALLQKPIQGKLFDGWWKDLAKSTQNNLNTQITLGLSNGDSVDDIVRRIRGTRAARFTDGVFQTTRRHATVITRTAVNHATTQARETSYQENDGVVKGVQYLATLDGRTSRICIELDGKIMPLAEGPRPPQHMQCRSTTTPILRSWEELGIDAKELAPETRASMNGQVPATLKYSDWLKNQPSAFQNKVLGRAQADLFRQGKLKLSKPNDASIKWFAANSGKAGALSAKQLKVKLPENELIGQVPTKTPKPLAPRPRPRDFVETTKEAKQAMIDEANAYFRNKGRTDGIALDDWTGDGYKVIRRIQQGIDTCKQFPLKCAFIKVMNKMMIRAPRYTGSLYRGLRFDSDFSLLDDLTKVGNQFETDTFTSWTHNLEQAKAFSRAGSKRMAVRMRTMTRKGGVALESMSGIPREAEVLMDKSSFRVLKSRQIVETRLVMDKVLKILDDIEPGFREGIMDDLGDLSKRIVGKKFVPFKVSEINKVYDKIEDAITRSDLQAGLKDGLTTQVKAARVEQLGRTPSQHPFKLEVNVIEVTLEEL